MFNIVEDLFLLLNQRANLDLLNSILPIECPGDFLECCTASFDEEAAYRHGLLSF